MLDTREALLARMMGDIRPRKEEPMPEPLDPLPQNPLALRWFHELYRSEKPSENSCLAAIAGWYESALLSGNKRRDTSVALKVFAAYYIATVSNEQAIWKDVVNLSGISTSMRHMASALEKAGVYREARRVIKVALRLTQENHSVKASDILELVIRNWGILSSEAAVYTLLRQLMNSLEDGQGGRGFRRTLVLILRAIK